MTSAQHQNHAYARLERLCSSRNLQGITQTRHEDGPALATTGGAFARLHDPATLVLACPVDQKVLLMEIDPEIYFETEREVGKPVVLIRLDAIGDEELALRLDDAWTLFASEEQIRQRG